MRTNDEVKQKLEELYERRLKLRLKRCTRHSFKNCKWNKRLDVEDSNGDLDHRVGLCFNPAVTGGTEVVRECGEPQAETCQEYDSNHTKESIVAQFKADISDPKICGQKEPKIAILLWFLHDNKDFPERTEISVWQKLRGMFRK